MRHYKVDEHIIENLEEKKEIACDLPITDIGYYHLFKHKEPIEFLSDDDMYSGFSRTNYFYPNGLMAYYDGTTLKAVDRNRCVYGQKGKNPYQWMAIDSLLRPEKELVVLTGVAGSGKTFLALAYALNMIDNPDCENKYNRIVLSRPKQTLERKDGAVPGDDDDKIKAYMMPFYDNAKAMGATQTFRRMVGRGDDIMGIEFQPLEKIKGRSYANAIVIIDESEDMRYREVESLLTRSDNAKVILSGDIKQIDDKTFTKNNIPLVYTIKKTEGQLFASHINNPVTSRKGELTKFVINNFSQEEYRSKKY